MRVKRKTTAQYGVQGSTYSKAQSTQRRRSRTSRLVDLRGACRLVVPAGRGSTGPTRRSQSRSHRIQQRKKSPECGVQKHSTTRQSRTSLPISSDWVKGFLVRILSALNRWHRNFTAGFSRTARLNLSRDRAVARARKLCPPAPGNFVRPLGSAQRWTAGGWRR